MQSQPTELFNIGKELNQVQRTAVQDLPANYDVCFSEDISLGRCKAMSMDLLLTTDSPFIGKRYQVPFAKREKLSAIVANLLKLLLYWWLKLTEKVDCASTIAHLTRLR